MSKNLFLAFFIIIYTIGFCLITMGYLAHNRDVFLSYTEEEEVEVEDKNKQQPQNFVY